MMNLKLIEIPLGNGATRSGAFIIHHSVFIVSEGGTETERKAEGRSRNDEVQGIKNPVYQRNFILLTTSLFIIRRFRSGDENV